MYLSRALKAYRTAEKKAADEDPLAVTRATLSVYICLFVKLELFVCLPAPVRLYQGPGARGPVMRTRSEPSYTHILIHSFPLPSHSGANRPSASLQINPEPNKTSSVCCWQYLTEEDPPTLPPPTEVRHIHKFESCCKFVGGCIGF